MGIIEMVGILLFGACLCCMLWVGKWIWRAYPELPHYNMTKTKNPFLGSRYQMIPALWAGRRRWRQHRHRQHSIPLTYSCSHTHDWRPHHKRYVQTLHKAAQSRWSKRTRSVIKARMMQSSGSSVATNTETSGKTLHTHLTAVPTEVQGAGDLADDENTEPYAIRITDEDGRVTVKHFQLNWRWRTLRATLALVKRLEVSEVFIYHDDQLVQDEMWIPQPIPGRPIEVRVETQRLQPMPNPQQRHRSRSRGRWPAQERAMPAHERAMQDAAVQAGPAMINAENAIVIHVPHRDWPLDLEIHESDLPAGIALAQVTPSQLEATIMDQYGPQLRRLGARRLCFVDGYRMLRPYEAFPQHLMSTPRLVAYPCDVQGAAIPEDQYRQALDLAKWAASGSLSSGQLRLLLRGEPPLQRRLLGKQDKKEAKDILVAAAKRYQMHLQDQPMIKEPPRAVHNDSKWTEVVKKTRKPKQVQKTTQDHPRPVELRLLEDDWDVSVRTEPKLGQAGVYLAQSLDHGKKLERQFTQARLPTAIISLERLRKARSCVKQTLRVKELRDGRERDRIVEGYICQMAETAVVHKYLVRQARTSRPQTTSTVLAMCITRSAVTNEEWEKLKQAVNVKIFNESFGENIKMAALDIFRIQCIDEVYQALLTVKEDDVESWMSCKGPFTLSPMGEQLKGYRLIWDKTIETIQQARERFEELPGYVGCVCTKAGHFAGRIREADFSKAATLAGKAAGTTYRIVGLPVDVEAQEVAEIMQEVGWVVVPKEASRRIRKGTATWLVSSTDTPPATTFAITFGHGELVRLQVETLVKQYVVQPKPPDATPTSWIQVASRSLGKIRQPDEASQPDDEEPPTAADVDMPESEVSDDDEKESYPDHSPPLYRPAPKRGPPQKDLRLDKLESAVGEMRMMMQQLLLLNSGQQPQGSMKRASTHEDVTGKGRLPWKHPTV